MPVSRLQIRLGFVVLAASALGACQQRAPGPTVVAAAPPSPVSLPSGSGCGPEIARTQVIVDSDVATGNLNRPVGERFSADLGRAASECSAGRSGEALGLLSAARSRYGYR